MTSHRDKIADKLYQLLLNVELGKYEIEQLEELYETILRFDTRTQIQFTVSECMNEFMRVDVVPRVN